MAAAEGSATVVVTTIDLHLHIEQLQVQLDIAVVCHRCMMLDWQIIWIVSVDDGKFAALESCKIEGRQHT